MSLFSWFTRRPARPSAASRNTPHPPAASQAHTSPPALGAPAGAWRNERMERRELLYAVVRNAMIRAGVLSAHYKFKVLSLDPRGHQFLVMIDLAPEYGGQVESLGRLGTVETLITDTARSRHDVLVTAVYWRIKDFAAAARPAQPAAVPKAPQTAPQTTPPSAPAAVAAARQRCSAGLRPHRRRRGRRLQACARQCRCCGKARRGQPARRPGALRPPALAKPSRGLRRHGTGGPRRPRAHAR